MYKTKKYSVRNEEQFTEHLKWLRKNYEGNETRAFLGDGDVFTLPAERLLSAMGEFKRFFPKLKRFGMYGSVYNFHGKTISDLTGLKGAGLRTIYLGLESGDAETLAAVKKPLPSDILSHIAELCTKADIRLSVMILSGIGGQARTEDHASKSARALNILKPHYTSILSLATEHSILHKNTEYTGFTVRQYVREIYTLVSEISYPTIFRSNHSSNILSLSGTLPRGCQVLIDEINAFATRFAQGLDIPVNQLTQGILL